MAGAEENMNFMSTLMASRPAGGSDEATRAFIDNLAAAHLAAVKTVARRAEKED